MEFITLEELKSDMSKPAIEAMEELAFETVEKLKDKGLMATELCFIALEILHEHSDNAKGLIDLDKMVSKTIADAEELLNSIKP
jgi:hypothetical protein